jgi:NAD(P)-dependent dehydrogenase (short-subunit alcohol dehydrogenase family)
MDANAFAGQVVLVTGAAAGIGRELARRLAALGAALVLCDRDEAGLHRLKQELDGGGTRCWCVVAALDDPAAAEKLAERAFSEAGGVDGLVNCAGLYPVTPLQELTVEEWDRVLNTNLRAPFLVTQAVARRMIAAGRGGSVVNVSSTASRLARPGIAHYGASKAGLNQLTAVQAVELAPHGIRVNAVLPGLIGTEHVLGGSRDAVGRAEHEAKLARIPLGRVGEPGEVVALVVFLLSAQAAYCTGGLYPVDGGFTLGIPSYGPAR